MRLINADELMERIRYMNGTGNSGDNNVDFETVEWMISDQPTEYDVEAVLNQISELNENEFCYGNVVRIIKAGGLN